MVTNPTIYNDSIQHESAVTDMLFHSSLHHYMCVCPTCYTSVSFAKGRDFRKNAICAVLRTASQGRPAEEGDLLWP